MCDWAVCPGNVAFQTKTPRIQCRRPAPDGGPDSFLAGYSFYAPLTDRSTIGVVADTSTPGVFNSYAWTDGKQTDLQALPPLPNLTGTNTYINWINQWGLAAGYGTRIDSVTSASIDNAVIWTPDGHIFELSTPEGDQSHAVWVNDFGQVSGWIANSTVDPCAFGVGLQSQGAVWEFGSPRPLGTLGGTDSYGEFINNLGQVSGHSETSNTANADTGCPPFDPFIWENGKITDINPGNFGGAEGGTNFLNNQAQAVGFGTLSGEVVSHPFLWSRGKLTDLFTVGNLGGPLNSAYNVNELGHAVGVNSNADGAILAVLWRNAGFTDLLSLNKDGDDCSEPFRINSWDQIVGVSFSCETGVEHAFLWENGELEDRLCTRICENVHSTRLSGRRLFSLRRPPKQPILARMADKPGPSLWKWRSEGGMMERLPQRFCPPSELGNPRRTRVSTFPQRRRLRLSNWTQPPNPRKSNVSTDSRPEPEDLNQLIPTDSGLELESANWISDEGVIAAQAVLTEGSDSGDSRAVLLIPSGECDRGAQAESTAAPKNATITSKSGDPTTGTPKKSALVKTADGRLNPTLLRPFAPAVLRSKAQN